MGCPELAELFISVVGCRTCPTSLVLRDETVNPPQPGWVGRRYKGLMFVGQNPGERPRTPKQIAADVSYIESLLKVRDIASLETMLDVLRQSTDAFVYYRSFHFNVDIEDVAYINTVRCRTRQNAAPGRSVVDACKAHFRRWVEILRPRGVVYLGVFAERATSDLLQERDIPFVTISRQKSLKSAQRAEQMDRANEFVRSVFDTASAVQ